MLFAIGACLEQCFDALIEARNNLIEARSERASRSAANPSRPLIDIPSA
ncbi:MAG: hypothetical protein ACHP6J_04060 [Burkholderiales bacterium]